MNQNQGLRVAVLIPEPFPKELPGELTFAIVDLLTELGLGNSDEGNVKSLVYTGPDRWPDVASLKRRLRAEHTLLMVAPPENKGDEPPINVGFKYPT